MASVGDASTTRDRSWHRYEWWIVAAIALFAVAVRLLSLLASGGPGGYVNGDDGAYFGASQALVHGALPYRDFLLLHPPGAVLAYAPVAAVGQVIGEAQSFMAARLLVVVVGAASAVLAYVAARRAGLAAAATSGVLYACWFSAVYVERTTLLEPLVNLAVLASLVFAARATVTARTAVAAGSFLGIAAAVKLSNVVAVVVLVVWMLVVHGRRRGLQSLAGAAVAFAVLVAPLALADPAAAWRMSVVDQALRQSPGVHLDRVGRLLGLDSTSGFALLVALVLWVVVAVAAVAAVRAYPWTSLWVALLVLGVVQLLTSSLYFTHYAATVAPMFALVLGAGTQVLVDAVRRQDRPRRVVAVGIAAAVAVGLVAVQARAVAGIESGRDFPRAAVARLVADGQCVTADSATPLILAGVLGRDIERGCPVVVDFTGQVYETRGEDGDRRDSAEFQAWARDYLLSGDRIVLVRLDRDGLSRETRAALAQRPVLREGTNVLVLGAQPSG